MVFFKSLFLKKEPLPERWMVIDTETTGLDPNKDRILSIACLPISSQRILLAEHWDCYVQQSYYNPTATPVHGITRSRKTKGCTEEEAMHQIIKMTENVLLVGHHICFDVAIINQALKRHQLPALPAKFIDTAHLFKRLYPLERLDNPHIADLDFLCKKLQVKTHGRHTAAGDTLLTALCLIKMLKKNKLTTQALQKYLITCR